jgi:A/G-specific adenine glycosylase
LIKLKGIGTYTAAAVASIAFKEPVPLVDGNVYRLLARYYGIDTPTDTAKGKQVFNLIADQLLDRRHPDVHNQAVMEFGALICLPRNPLCSSCPLSSSCIAFHTGRTNELPVKQGKNQLRQRYFNYLFIAGNSFCFLKKRGGNDIWNSLYEFPLVETESPVTVEQLQDMQEWRDIFGNTTVPGDLIAKTFRHQLTHQVIWGNFYFIKIQDGFKPGGYNYTQVAFGNLWDFAVPRLIDKYLVYLKLEGLM